MKRKTERKLNGNEGEKYKSGWVEENRRWDLE